MVFVEGDLIQDEAKFLTDHSHSFKGLYERGGTAGRELSSNIDKAIHVTKFVEGCFVLSAAAFLLPKSLGTLCVISTILILGFMASKLLVLLLSALVGKYDNKSYGRSLLYWSYWPGWILCLSFVAACAGGITGHYIFTHSFQTYQEIGNLKPYMDIDPSIVPGKQIQDAGAIEFTQSTRLDTQQAGCFMGGGHTYCVAPIVKTGHVSEDIAESPRHGSYDYFAVGVDCCSCSTSTFQCGDFRDDDAHGGIRSVDAQSRPFFRLAVDAWASNYRKTSKHPLFFEWVRSPVDYWRKTRDQTLIMLGTAFAGSLIVAFGLALTLCRILQVLKARNVAVPDNTPSPPQGFERLWSRFLPEMLQQYRDQVSEALYGSTAR